MYIAQQYFGLSDEGVEDALYHRQAIRGFVGIDLTRESAPDATTLLKFRRLLEQNKPTQRIFNEISTHLASKALTTREGMIVDATLIAAPPSAVLAVCFRKSSAGTRIPRQPTHPSYVSSVKKRQRVSPKSRFQPHIGPFFLCLSIKVSPS